MTRLLILLALTALLCSGCVTVQVETTIPSQNGALGNYSGSKLVTCKASYTRFWFEQEGFKVKVCGGEAGVTRSTNNTEALDALLPFIVKGAAKAAL